MEEFSSRRRSSPRFHLSCLRCSRSAQRRGGSRSGVGEKRRIVCADRLRIEVICALTLFAWYDLVLTTLGSYGQYPRLHLSFDPLMLVVVVSSLLLLAQLLGRRGKPVASMDAETTAPSQPTKATPVGDAATRVGRPLAEDESANHVLVASSSAYHPLSAANGATDSRADNAVLQPVMKQTPSPPTLAPVAGRDRNTRTRRLGLYLVLGGVAALVRILVLAFVLALKCVTALYRRT